MPRQAIPAWAADYIGLPFVDLGRDRAGVDCWGLLRLAMAEQFGVEIPSFVGDYETAYDVRTVARLIAENMDPWRPVPAGSERAGDGILLKRSGRGIHVGLVVVAPYMLHIERGIDSCVESYDGPMWRHGVEGFYRHRDMK